LIDSAGILSEKGLIIINLNIEELFKKYQEGYGNRDRLRLCLYLTIAFNTGLIYSSFVRSIREEEALAKQKEAMGTDLLEYCIEIAERVEKIAPMIAGILDKELPLITKAEYVGMYETEKRKAFTKEIFDTHEVHLPCMGERPEGMDRAMEAPSPK